MQESPVAPLTPDEFRALGHRFIDWIADYHARIEEFPVRSRVRPGDVLAALPENPPEHGLGACGWDAILGDLDRIVLPGITHWQSPRFFAYFPANASFPAMLGDLVSSGLGVQGMLWITSPAATELETRVLDWLAQLLDLPADFWSTGAGGGSIQGTASEATLVALVAARHRTGAMGGPLVAYASNQAHSSVIKAAMIAGVAPDATGGDGVRLVDTDECGALDPAALAAAMHADRAAGRRPFFVCATVGTTSSGAVDPLPPIAATAKEHGAWVHVDAAWAGAACICPEHRPLLDGVEGCDSFTFNPHKWLLTNFDCNALWVRDRAALTGALSVTPEYLRNRASECGEVLDYRDWQVPLGRRFRALKLWFVMRHYGAAGLRAHVRRHVALAERFEAWVREDPRFELAAPRHLALVCFRLRGGDDANRELLERVNAGGRAYLTHTTLAFRGGGPRFVLRLAIGAPGTRERHVRETWELIRELAGASSPQGG